MRSPHNATSGLSQVLILLTGSAMNGVGVTSRASWLDNRVDTSKTGTALAFHSEEGVGGARENGDCGREGCNRLHFGLIGFSRAVLF